MHESKGLVPLSAINIYENEGLVLFYQVREVLAKYTASWGVADRREIALDVAAVLEAFLERTFSTDEVEYLDKMLGDIKSAHSNSKSSSQVEGKGSNSGLFLWLKRPKANIVPSDELDVDDPKVQGVFQLLNHLSPEGVNLLNIKTDVDLRILKDLYKTAALRYHPDRGGSVEDMQIINDAYSLFHDAIINYRPAGELSQVGQFWPENLRELEFSIRTILASIYGDFYAADYGFNHIRKNIELKKQLREESVGRYLNSISDVGRTLSNPCRGLGRMEMRRELKEAAEYTHELSQLYIKYWEPSEEDINEYTESDDEDEILSLIRQLKSDKPDMSWMPTREEMLLEAGVKLVINHPEQAKNAYRLGVIDEKRYQKTMKKYGARVEETEGIVSKIRDFILSGSLQLDVSNSDYTLPDRKPTVVTPLEYHVLRFDQMEEDQKYEYIINFSGKEVSEKVLKYLKLRAMDLICGLIYNFDQVSQAKIRKELDLYASLEEFSYFENVRELLDFLASLSSDERNERLTLLQELDDPDYQPSGSLGLSVSLESLFGNSEGGENMIIGVEPEYVDFATASVEAIHKFKKSGDFRSDYTESYNADMAALRKFENSPVARKHEKVWMRSSSPTPEQTVDAFEPYVEGLLKLGKDFHPKSTEDLQVGYSINKMTAAYGKLKNWERVEHWISLFFALPKEYRGRSSKSELEVLRKRLERAKKQLEKKSA